MSFPPIYRVLLKYKSILTSVYHLTSRKDVKEKILEILGREPERSIQYKMISYVFSPLEKALLLSIFLKDLMENFEERNDLGEKSYKERLKEIRPWS